MWKVPVLSHANDFLNDKATEQLFQDILSLSSSDWNEFFSIIKSLTLSLAPADVLGLASKTAGKTAGGTTVETTFKHIMHLNMSINNQGLFLDPSPRYTDLNMHH